MFTSIEALLFGMAVNVLPDAFDALSRVWKDTIGLRAESERNRMELERIKALGEVQLALEKERGAMQAKISANELAVAVKAGEVESFKAMVASAESARQHDVAGVDGMSRWVLNMEELTGVVVTYATLGFLILFAFYETQLPEQLPERSVAVTALVEAFNACIGFWFGHNAKKAMRK